MSDLMREAVFGQLMRWISGNRLFQYPGDKPDFQFPPQYQLLLEKGKIGNATDIEFEKDTALSQIPSRAESLPYSYERFDIEQRLEIERTKSLSIALRQTNDGIILVD
ncbi:uncharacterized protein Z519_06954 [Cladophialophora bantiana CBS 173.52]|uniref:Uncharacterized protein n=1 Tax=Cladophialophora bantiana (strain ATCC 10958 / CBS 173.52 / CDC B-1940 / NIH 8579) TaxID=1442370 RepID=A0A0D2FZS4_CLAB1|nr:uncharacterized protein Z519_06954 [Cladophialophora bantiana CBS 173.52]KIW91972.1 hypothetical protein Z519_06954 [Cladophialophora bantiana CBS 173.52]